MYVRLMIVDCSPTTLLNVGKYCIGNSLWISACQEDGSVIKEINQILGEKIYGS